jgi:hypothetical protein
MQFTKRQDIVWNAILPILAGTVCYWVFSATTVSFSPVRNYLPDGLWAYAFCSTILIIWDRKIHLPWLFFIISVFSLFEILQAVNIIAGTGDVLDIVVYLLFGAAAVLLNNAFLTLFAYKPKST